ncbi:MAG: hypothetical protein ACJ788_10590 [Ktedonobacteraceae bacterium]
MFARAEARHGISVARSRSGNRYLAAEDQGCGNQGCLAWRLSPARCRAGGSRARANLKARSENRAGQPDGSRKVNLGAQEAGVYLAPGEFAP